MPSPLAHSLAGYLIGETTETRLTENRWVSLGLLILFANLPDMDYLPGLLVGRPNAYHHYAAHSFAAALFVGFVGALLFTRGGPHLFRVFVMLALAYSSHLLLDYLTLDTSRPYGLQLFWPFSSKFFASSWTLFMDIKKGQTSGEFVTSLLVWHNLRGVIWEGVVFLPLILGSITWKRRKRLRDIATINF